MILAYDNLSDYSTASLLCASQVSTLPVTNLKDTRIGRIMRSTAPTATVIDIDLGATKAFNVIALIGVDIVAGDTVNIQCSTVSAGGTDVLNTGAQNCNVVDGYDLFMYYRAASISARYIRLTINAASRAAAGFVDIGRLLVAPAIVPQYDPASYQDELIDGAVKDRGLRSGVLFVDKAYKMRRVSFTIKSMGETSARLLQTMDRAAGQSSQVFCCLRPTDATAWPKEAIFGYFSNDNSMDYMVPLLFDKSYQIEQAL